MIDFTYESEEYQITEKEYIRFLEQSVRHFKGFIDKSMLHGSMLDVFKDGEDISLVVDFNNTDIMRANNGHKGELDG